MALLEQAKEADAAAIAALRIAAARDLTDRFGHGTWSFAAESEAGVRAEILTSRIFLMREAGVVVATLRLSTNRPWLTDFDFFTPCEHPVFLTSMAVLPRRQHSGVGRSCLEQVKHVATNWPANALRLDAYDSPAGAGEFYRKCGFREVRRAPYNGTPLVFFEWLAPVLAGSTVR